MKSAVKMGIIFASVLNETGEHHITIPQHNPLKIGTFSAILNDIAKHFSLSREELINKLFSAR